MARDFGPFPSKPMYEVVNRRMQRALAEATASTGFAKSGQGAVTAGTGAELVIAAYPDGALVDGLWVENPTSETVTLTTNTGSTNPRIDRLVLRLDTAAETIAPFQIVGTPAASPSAPPLVKTATVFDMPLCQYRFPGSGSAQNPTNIVDERVIAVGASLSSGQSTLAGGTPPAGQTMITKAYTINVATNSAGDATHSFPGGAFPNGVASIVLSSGDVVAGGHAIAAVHPNVTLSAVNTRHYQAGGAVCNGTGTGVTVRLNVIAVGW